MNHHTFCLAIISIIKWIHNVYLYLILPSILSYILSFVPQKYQNGETSGDEEEFLNALRSSVEIIVNRMGSNSARGRSIATDSSVQTLFMTINAMHPELMKHLSGLEESRSE